MSLHKLTAGTGYTYLTRQVAAHDRAERSQVGLAAYYEEKGESPGRWLGNGLAALDLADGGVVTEEQMKLLFGLVGDDQQLTAVAASGVFRDLVEQGAALGTTIRLTELHRFTDADEAAATLGIRSGDPAALEHYLSKGRVHVGKAGAAVDQAFHAWRADVAAGKSSLLLAASRDTVRGLNELAQADRLAARSGRPGREAVLADGTRASAGDVVITRHNDRSLRGREGSWVKNGDRWVVREVDRSGDMHVARAGHQARRLGPTLRLPADYVVQHVQLGYASTIHGAQGATVDTTHTVVTGAESRQGLYVALSRGRHENHLYLSDDEPAPDGFVLELPADHGPREVLTRILERDDRAESATRAMAADPARELGRAIQQYEDALPLLAEHLLGDSKIRALDSALERWMPGLTNQPGYAGLRGKIALRWVDGESPKEIVEQATWWQDEGDLHAAEDPAAALARGVSRRGPVPVEIGPHTWLSTVPDSLRAHPETRSYLDRMTEAIGALVVTAGHYTAASAPPEIRLSAAQRDQDLRPLLAPAEGRPAPGFGR